MGVAQEDHVTHVMWGGDHMTQVPRLLNCALYMTGKDDRESKQFRNSTSVVSAYVMEVDVQGGLVFCLFLDQLGL